MNKKISLGAAIAYMAIVAAVTFSITWMYSWNSFNLSLTDLSQRQKMYSKLAEVDEYVRGNYYGQVDEDTLMSGIVAGYIKGLGDENAKYLSAAEYESYTKTETGKYVGIGVVTSPDDSGYILITEVYPESPAATAGIAAGDLIVSVDGVTPKASNYDELAATFKGEAGAKISLVVRTGKDDRTLELTRRSIDVPTVKLTVTDDHIAYVAFSEINSTTATQFEAQLKSAVANGATSAIIDMRSLSCNNVKYITDMLSVVLPECTLAYSKGSDGELVKLATADSRYIDIPLVVLQDGTTSGTAELFGLALRDYGKASLVGSATAGKGTIQEVKKLTDGSAVVITTARYASPKGTTYDQQGVAPDYEVALSVTEENRASVIGNADLDAPYKKALELAAAAAAQVQSAQTQASSGASSESSGASSQSSSSAAASSSSSSAG